MNATAEVKITPKMMADAFMHMDSTEQADFFIEVGKIVDARPFNTELQMLYAKDEVFSRAEKKLGCLGIREMSAWFWLATQNNADLY